MGLQRRFFEQKQLVVKILCVIARFTASLIVKIQPESTSFIPKFTRYAWPARLALLEDPPNTHQRALLPKPLPKLFEERFWKQR